MSCGRLHEDKVSGRQNCCILWSQGGFETHIAQGRLYLAATRN